MKKKNPENPAIYGLIIRHLFFGVQLDESGAPGSDETASTQSRRTRQPFVQIGSFMGYAFYH